MMASQISVSATAPDPHPTAVVALAVGRLGAAAHARTTPATAGNTNSHTGDPVAHPAAWFNYMWGQRTNRAHRQ